MIGRKSSTTENDPTVPYGSLECDGSGNCVLSSYVDYIRDGAWNELSTYAKPICTFSQVDGGYGEWESWQDCNGGCDSTDSVVKRTRTCDSPSASLGGTDCSAATESQESDLDCPSGTHLSYNSGTSFCFELMSNADCVDMLTNCQTTRGQYASLLTISNSDIFKDVESVILGGNAMYALMDLTLNSGDNKYYWSDSTVLYTEGRWLGDDPDSGEEIGAIGCLTDYNGLCGFKSEDDTCTSTAYICQVARIDGAWALWTTWSSCGGSVACSAGSLFKRTRTCTNPAPLGVGTPCPGDSSQESALGKTKQTLYDLMGIKGLCTCFNVQSCRV
ncbi:coadhesin-like [Watersipora subatra]|uniref:coadhesin-like n=1 Tax=Watersipora subatra TaxID=2589382 RepID=UPI00355C36A5